MAELLLQGEGGEGEGAACPPALAHAGSLACNAHGARGMSSSTTQNSTHRQQFFSPPFFFFFSLLHVRLLGNIWPGTVLQVLRGKMKPLIQAWPRCYSYSARYNTLGF